MIARFLPTLAGGVVVLAVGLCAALSTSSSQEQPAPAANAASLPPVPAADKPPRGSEEDDIVDALLEIRRQNGSLLRGTIFGADDQEDETAFATALREVMRRAPTPPRAIPTSEPSSPFAPIANRNSDATLNINLVESIEQTASLLDAKAAQLERSLDYELADRTSREARRLRRLAREWRTR